MGRVSFDPKTFTQSGQLKEGNIEIAEASNKIHQFPPNSKTGDQSAPFVAVRWGVYKLDDELNRVDDVIHDMIFPVAFARKDANTKEFIMDDDGNHTFDFLPARAKSRDDEDPESQGNAIDSEGNCLINGVEGREAAIWAESAWAKMIASLLHPGGLKPTIAANGFMDDFVGMKLYFYSREEPKPANWKKDLPPTAMLCGKIHVHPGQKPGAKTGAKKAASAGAPAAAGVGKANGSAATPAAESAAELVTGAGADSGPSDRLLAGVRAFIIKNKGKSFATRADFGKGVGVSLMAKAPDGKPYAGMKEIQPFVNANINTKDEDAFGAFIMNVGEVDGGGGVSVTVDWDQEKGTIQLAG